MAGLLFLRLDFRVGTNYLVSFHSFFFVNFRPSHRPNRRHSPFLRLPSRRRCVDGLVRFVAISFTRVEIRFCFFFARVRLLAGLEATGRIGLPGFTRFLLFFSSFLPSLWVRLLSNLPENFPDDRWIVSNSVCDSKFSTIFSFFLSTVSLGVT